MKHYICVEELTDLIYEIKKEGKFNQSEGKSLDAFRVLVNSLSSVTELEICKDFALKLQLKFLINDIKHPLEKTDYYDCLRETLNEIK